MIEFTLFKVKISFSVMFAAFITIMLYIDKTGIMLPAFCAVILHEAGHLAAMKAYGYKPSAISVKIGYAAIYGRFAQTLKEENIITLSGPLTNIFLFILFYFLYCISKNELLFVYGVINAAIGLFNLLPVKGLDGCTIIYNTILYKCGEKAAEKACLIISVITCILLFSAGAAVFLTKTGNFSLMLVSVYLLCGFLIKQRVL